ncbi:MAG: DUF2141 domain-containing protein [Pseudomonadota bacterium]
MKLFARSLCFAGFALASTTASADTLSLVVENIQKQEGVLMIALFDSAEAFNNSGAPVDATIAKVTGETVKVLFEDVAPGQYAIKMYHDANENGEMDTNMMGIPVETYGFSGNKGRFGPPPFEDAVFDVAEGDENVVTVKLR